MNIHEHQAKSILKSFGVPILAGEVVFDPEKTPETLQRLGPAPWVIKAQIHAGGRGKAGGVKLAFSEEEAIKYAKDIFGKTLITHQTGPLGKEVKRLYIESGCNIDKELYLSLLVDRSKNCISVIASEEGGVDIEEVAATHPDKIIKIEVDPSFGIQAFHLRDMAFGLNMRGEIAKHFMKTLNACYQAFVTTDASLLEINPLVITKEETIVALDAKMSFDDNALFRHPDLEELKDENEDDPLELEAQQFGLNYIKLDGPIGCMVNGAGLAMATMDIIKLYGSSPANFLDVGGGATREAVTEAFKIILADTHVRGILVNIFGGIMHCDVIANGIIEAAKDVNLSIPLVVRLEGTHADKGKDILKNSGLLLQTADDLTDAAKKIVMAVGGCL